MIACCFFSKKSLCLALALALLSSVALAAFPEGTAGRANEIKVGLITDSLILMDSSFNEMAYDGLLRAKTDFGIEETVYLSVDGDAIADNLAQCALDGNDLCFMVGFSGTDATYAAALAHPTTLFSILDVSYDDYPDNLQGVVFTSEEAAYLAGTLAGKMTESNTIGMIGGMDIPPVNVFLCGYEQGAADANPEITVLSTYTDNFGDPAVGAHAAQEMLDQESDVIFPAAGNTGSGALLTATQAGAWAVGVDSDQYLTVFAGGAVDGADHLLTSAMKRLDNAVYKTISDTLSDAFVSGSVVYDLAMGGVGLAPYHDADGLIPPAAKAAVEAARQGLLDGSIDPLRTCRTVELYLPLLGKSSPPEF